MGNGSIGEGPRDKHEDPSSDPQGPHRKVRWMAVTPTWEKGDRWSLGPHLSDSVANERPYFKEESVGGASNTDLWPLQVNAHILTSTLPPPRGSNELIH